jgi:phospholipid/cholesterol/gamma-HCH transport system permease protein
MQLLVLPRVFALVLALPLLTVYADGLGVFGGMLIASNQLNVSFTEFVARFEEAVALRHFLIGIGKTPFLQSSLPSWAATRVSRSAAVWTM